MQFSVVVGDRTARIQSFDLRVVEDNSDDSHDNIMLGGVPPQTSVRKGADFVFVPFLINPGNHPVVFESIPDNLEYYGLAIDPETGRVSGRLTRDLDALFISARLVEVAQEQSMTPHGIIGPVCNSIIPGQNVFGNPPFTDSNGYSKYYRCVDP